MWLFLAHIALAEPVDTTSFKQRPVAGHPIVEFRAGIQTTGPQHPTVCAEISPLAFLALSACGNGSGILHQGTEPDMVHFLVRGRLLEHSHGRWAQEIWVGGGFAEVQRSTDQAGFRFGKATEPDQVEAAGGELAVGAKTRAYLTPGLFLVADLSVGAAYIPAAQTVVGVGPTVPYALLTVGVGL